MMTSPPALLTSRIQSVAAPQGKQVWAARTMSNELLPVLFFVFAFNISLNFTFFKNVSLASRTNNPHRCSGIRLHRNPTVLDTYIPVWGCVSRNLCLCVCEDKRVCAVWVCVYSSQPLMGIMCGVSSADTQKHANPTPPPEPHHHQHHHARSTLTRMCTQTHMHAQIYTHRARLRQRVKNNS